MFCGATVMTNCVALYPYKYELGDGKEVSFDIGEQFVLLSKTNADWWQVQRGDEKPIYVPASYMREIIQDDECTNCSSGEVFPSSPLSESKNFDEECERVREEYSTEIVSQPVVLVHDEEANNVDYDEVELSPRTKSLSSTSGVRQMAKTLETFGLRTASLSLPTTARPKSQSLPPGWVVTKDKMSGRVYYFNTKTQESSWKPPRQQHARTAPSWVQSPTLGWYITDNSHREEIIYVNDHNDEQWQLSTDEQGRVFYFQLNGTETAWDLPQVEPATRQSFEALDVTYRRRSPNLNQRTSKVQSLLRPQPSPPPQVDLSWSTLPPPPPVLLRDHERTESVQSTDSLSSGGADDWPAPPSPANVSSMQSIEKQGIVNRKKLMENGGKKAKKSSWTSTFVMLLSSNMVFYKDQKAAASKPSHPHGRPESSCELQGATLEWLAAGTGSSRKRKNVFQIKTISGMVFLLQSDNSNEATVWFDAIATIIRNLNDEDPAIIGTVQEKGQTALSGYESDDALEEPTTPVQLSPGPQLARNWSKKVLGPDKDENKSKIRDKLRKFLTKRPLMEELEKKGILKERVFGCHLSTLCEREKTTVPSFVPTCIEAIEAKGLTYDGMYRVCGNASTVHKIRIMVDQEEKITLGTAPFDEVHALTGALKLFFRELPEPLIPFDFFSGFVEAIKQSTRKDKIGAIKTLSAQLPKVNCDTLRMLMNHLRRVMNCSDSNRMHAQNLAIVWGPNLMWPRYEAGNIAIQMVHQNQITEFLLLEMDSVLK